MITPHPIFEIYRDGTRWVLSPDDANSRCYFGGPLTSHVETKVPLRKASLHHLGSINIPELGGGDMGFGFNLPLLYGICHEGCEIEYRKIATEALEICSLSPKKADDGYPYHGYPTILPYYRLGILSQSEVSQSDFEYRLANTGWDLNPSFIYVIVMQHPHIGHCLFDTDDEAEIVFEYQPDSGICRATNQCG